MIAPVDPYVAQVEAAQAAAKERERATALRRKHALAIQEFQSPRVPCIPEPTPRT